MHSSRMCTVRCSGRLWGERCLPRGVSAKGCLPRGGVCLGDSVCKGGVYLGGVCLGGVYLGGVCPGDVYLGGCLPRRVSARYPPVGRMTGRCKKHYLAATTLRIVNKNFFPSSPNKRCVCLFMCVYVRVCVLNF